MTAVTDDPRARTPVPAPDETDYPAAYVAAAEASKRSQASLVYLSVADIGFSLLAALVSLAAPLVPVAGASGRPTPTDLILAACALPLVVSVILKLAGQASGFETAWYRGRAVAESAKSMTWRYMMDVTPYRGERADRAFASDLAALLDRAQLRESVIRRAELPLQITPGMRAARLLGEAERRERYVGQRLLGQAEWYRGRALANRRNATQWLWGGIALQLAAVVVAIVAIMAGADPSRGSDFLRLMALLATISLAGTAWTERNRYGERARLYSGTMQELLLVASTATAASGESGLDEAVREGEDAITREHRMWLAQHGERQ